MKRDRKCIDDALEDIRCRQGELAREQAALVEESNAEIRERVASLQEDIAANVREQQRLQAARVELEREILALQEQLVR